MADVARLLELMHPMREPPQPVAVSPYLATIAFGCAVALAAFVAWRVASSRRFGLRRSARAALAASRILPPADRLAAQANLLRRIARAILGEKAARSQGAAWLATLDEVFRTRFFTVGSGQAYGDALYARAVPDVDALDHELDGLLTTLSGRPPKPGGGLASGEGR